jgi:hypothetical protein
MMCLQTVFLDHDDKSENGADGGTLNLTARQSLDEGSPPHGAHL